MRASSLVSLLLLFGQGLFLGGDGLRLKRKFSFEKLASSIWSIDDIPHDDRGEVAILERILGQDDRRDVDGEGEPVGLKKTYRSYVINMDHRTDRLELFAKTMVSKHSWLKEKTCRISAVNGNALTEQDLSPGGWAFGLAEPEALKAAKENIEFYKNNAWPHMTPGGMGLILSHVKAWKDLVASKDDIGVIFEDDLLQYSSDFQEQFEKLLSPKNCASETPEERLTAYTLGHTAGTERSCVPNGWDIVQMQSCWSTNGWLRRSDLADFYVPEFLQDRATMREKKETKVVPTVLRCTGAYAITRDAAQKALNQFTPVKKGMMQLDNLFGTAPGWGGQQLLNNVLASDTGYRLYAFYPIIAQVGSLNKDGTTDSDVQGLTLRQSGRRPANYKAPLPTCPDM